MTRTSGLRICVASSGLGHVTRGAEAWAGYLGKALADRGEQVLLCKGGGTADADYERVIPCWNRDSQSTRRLLKCLPNKIGWRLWLGSPYCVEQTTFAWGLIRLLQREQIDVLHVKDPILALATQHAQRMGLCTTRAILSHGTEESPEFQQQITFLQHMAPWHREQAEAQGIWKETWRMIPNFVDTEQFRPGKCPALRREFGIPDEAVVVLVSSAIRSHHKRVDYLIDEFHRARMLRPNVPIWLVIAGARERETDQLIEKAEQLLGDRVRFAINFPSARMPQLYRMSNLVIHGALKEMFGNVFLEALATGVPCLVHDHPVMRWVVGEGGQALDLSIDGSLSDAILSLCEDEPELKRLGKLARRHCSDLFSRYVVVNQFLDYYQYAVGPSRMAA